MLCVSEPPPTHTHTHRRMCEVTLGTDEQKAELVSGCGSETKDVSKRERWEAQRENEAKEQNGCPDT